MLRYTCEAYFKSVPPTEWEHVLHEPWDLGCLQMAAAKLLETCCGIDTTKNHFGKDQGVERQQTQLCGNQTRPSPLYLCLSH